MLNLKHYILQYTEILFIVRFIIELKFCATIWIVRQNFYKIKKVF